MQLIVKFEAVDKPAKVDLDTMEKAFPEMVDKFFSENELDTDVSTDSDPDYNADSGSDSETDYSTDESDSEGESEGDPEVTSKSDDSEME